MCRAHEECCTNVESVVVKLEEDDTDEDDARSLLDRLRDVDRDESPVPGKLLRKYIGYAKKYVHPT